MTSSGSSSAFAGFRFPREVIAVAVRWYLRYGLSYRDVEELLAERGPFHLVKLANDCVTKVRRRVIWEQQGRRGRKIDPAWANRRRLLRG